jgi:organic radical activating enzyme
MKFPWQKYEEIPTERRNTLQFFITSKCNLKCEACFARKLESSDISLKEYSRAVDKFIEKGGKQINLLGGEPLLHPDLREMIQINYHRNLKTTLYTNGYFLNNYSEKDLANSKIRISLYCKSGGIKSAESLAKTMLPLEVCFMVSKNTSLEELLGSAKHIETNFNCNVFFISSIRELDNDRKEFFDDTENTLNLLKYKELVHQFLDKYQGNMEIHVSKRGVFESTTSLTGNKCKFANYFPGGKIIQCPYDVINLKFQPDYNFDSRNCQQSNSCLMTKVAYGRK